ncbi:hypothetical protein [Rhodoblastus sp.]|uniref:hypothetical protein n=1 Tax=Rhodoblastus sp. TaxID=1962975 RepID=UPI003F94EF8A
MSNDYSATSIYNALMSATVFDRGWWKSYRSSNKTNSPLFVEFDTAESVSAGIAGLACITWAQWVGEALSARMTAVKRSGPRGVTVVAFLMSFFGLAEVATGFTHQFFGLTTATGTTSAYAGASIGVLHAAAGLLVLIMRKWAAALAMVCLVADVVGRIAMVLTGLYPVDSPAQTFAIVTGTAVVVAFAIHILSKWRAFE